MHLLFHLLIIIIILLTLGRLNVESNALIHAQVRFNDQKASSDRYCHRSAQCTAAAHPTPSLPVTRLTASRSFSFSSETTSHQFSIFLPGLYGACTLRSGSGASSSSSSPTRETLTLRMAGWPEVMFSFAVPTSVHARYQLTKSLLYFFKRWVAFNKHAKLEPLYIFDDQEGTQEILQAGEKTDV
jgi:hypothetical protein